MANTHPNNERESVSIHKFAQFIVRRLARLKAGALKSTAPKNWARPELPTNYTIPDLARLKYLIDVAYLASFHKEESRQTRFTLGIQVASKAPRGSTLPSELMSTTLSNPLAFTAQSLRRLAPAAEESSEIIVVNMGSSVRRPWQIRRLFDLGWYEWDFVYGRRRSLYALGHALLVRVYAPGSLVVAAGPILVGQLRGGRIVRESDRVWGTETFQKYFRTSKERALDRAHESQALGHRVPKTEKTREIVTDWYRVTLSELLAQTVRIGHGGTFVFLPNQGSSRANVRNFPVKVNYTIAKPSPRVFDAIVTGIGTYHVAQRVNRATNKQAGEISVRQKHQFRTAEAEFGYAVGLVLEGVKFVAGLSAVDGAVIMDNDLTVHGWGAVLHSNKGDSPLPEFHVATIYGTPSTRTLNLERYGTRHQSVARFVAEVPDSMALVVSQDGGAKLFMNTVATGRLVFDAIAASDWTSY